MQLQEIGIRIKDLRKEKKLTQENLALKCGISRVTLGKIEKGSMGNVSVKTLDLILFNLGYEIKFVLKNDFGLPTLK